MKSSSDNLEIIQALQAPFPAWAQKEREGGKGSVLTYIQPRVYMNRLDEVVGVANWDVHYEETPGGVKCKITIRFPDGQSSTKEDAGCFPKGNGGMSDEDIYKSGYSDAFKRACVAFGMGRYLYCEGVPVYLQDVYRNAPHAVGFLPREEPAHRNSQTNGNAPRPATNGSSNGHSNDGPKREYGKPQTGRQFYPWMKKQETESGMQLQKQVENFAKDKGQKTYSADWPDSFVPEAIVFVERLTSGATDQSSENVERPQAAVGAPSFYGVLETMLHDWDKVDPIDSSGRLVRRVELIDEAYRGLVAKGKLKAIEGVSEEEQYDAVEDVYPMNRVTIRTVLSSFMSLQGVRI